MPGCYMHVLNSGESEIHNHVPQWCLSSSSLEAFILCARMRPLSTYLWFQELRGAPESAVAAAAAAGASKVPADTLNVLLLP